MTFKKLLLGSAVAVTMGGVAQAADLPVAEPIDYVRVCDAFGNTYWYSPGTDTCLSVTGYVRLDTRIAAGISPATATSAVGNWKFLTKAALTVQAKSMTEWGPLVGYIRVAMTSDNNLAPPQTVPAGNAITGINNNVVAEEYYGSIGNLLFGFTESTYQYGYNVPFRPINNFGLLRLGNTDQVRFSFAANGWGIAVAAEDPRDRALATNVATMAFPDVVARLTGAVGAVSGQLSAGFGSRAVRNTWGVQGGLTFNLSSIAAGDSLKIVAAWSNTSPEWVSGGLADDGVGTYWSVLGTFQHVFNAQWAAAIYGAWAAGPVSGNAAQAAFVAQFTPVTNFTISGEVAWVRAQGAAAGALNGTVRFQRSF